MTATLRANVLILSLALLFAALPTLCQANPVRVVLSPSSAQVVERISPEVRIQGEGTGMAVILLPAQADPQTAQIELIQGVSALVDIRWERVEGEPVAVAALRGELEKQLLHHEELQSAAKAVDTEAKFWEAQAGSAPGDAAQAERMAKTIHSRMGELMRSRADLARRTKESGQRIEELRKRIEQLSGDEQRQWQGTLALGGLGKDKPVVGVSYVLHGCGWTPLVRVNGLPREQRIDFTFDAEVWQSTGMIWKDVDLSLATLRPRPRIEPPHLPQWVVQPRPQYLRREKAMDAMVAGAPMAMAEAESVREEELSSFSVYRLGKRTLPAGERMRLAVRTERWPAAFTHLLRPSQSPEAFVQGKVVLDKAIQIPGGTASYFLDGTLLGKRPLSLAGNELEFSFGPDPLVTGESLLPGRTAASKGLFGRRQVHVWDMRIDVRNRRGHEVALVVEEALPQSRHESVVVEIKADPGFARREIDRGVWAFPLKAGEAATLGLNVRVTAPEDMDLDLGRL
jgi:uncharacterized protein (TIGR02231 family)